MVQLRERMAWCDLGRLLRTLQVWRGHDIADLYKAETSISVAFKTVALTPKDVGAATRRNMRDSFFGEKIIRKMVQDIKALLGVSHDDDSLPDGDHVALWDGALGEVPSGRSYSEEAE